MCAKLPPDICTKPSNIVIKSGNLKGLLQRKEREDHYKNNIEERHNRMRFMVKFKLFLFLKLLFSEIVKLQLSLTLI